MNGTQRTGEPEIDLVSDLLVAVVGAAIAVLLLPLVVPLLVLAFVGPMAATRNRFWIVPRWWSLVVFAGVAVVVAVLAIEVALATAWVRQEALSLGFWSWAGRAWQAAWPWLVVNLLVGMLLVPAAISVRRRRLAHRVTVRRIPDPLLQERIEGARTRAAAWTASRRMGVQVDVQTGQIVSSDGATTAPADVGGRFAFGFIATPTVATWRDRFVDTRRVRDWVDGPSRSVTLPLHASAARALVVAESGTGKTVLLNGLIGCALASGWPVFVIDAKGDPADADDLVQAARAAGRSAAVGARWNLFAGTAEQVTEKLMRLLPPADGANQHYLDEARGVLGMVQGHAAIRSIADLRDRLETPAPHLRDPADRPAVEAVVDSRTGQTAARRVLQALLPALRPLEEWIDANGWSYSNPSADVTVMSLSPVDVTQARLGHLLMVDLRHFLATRLRRGDKSPVLVVVDEFPQLVTSDSDPGDTAAALLETARSSGAGLVLAAQSTAGLSNDETRRARALASGAALIIGRSKDPETAVKYAGTVVRLESSMGAFSSELRASSAQDSYVIPPQAVREAWDGSFWLVQAGGIAAFRTLPPARPRIDAGQPAAALVTPEVVPDTASEDAPARPITLMRRHEPAAPFLPPTFPTTRPAPPVDPSESITGLEIVLTERAPGHWDAVAYPATDTEVLDDVQDPERTSFAVAPGAPRTPRQSWVDEWTPTGFAGWGHPRHQLPVIWKTSLDELADRARRRYSI